MRSRMRSSCRLALLGVHHDFNGVQPEAIAVVLHDGGRSLGNQRLAVLGIGAPAEPRDRAIRVIARVPLALITEQAIRAPAVHQVRLAAMPQTRGRVITE